MAEVFVDFRTPVVAPDGTRYRARGCGGPVPDGTGQWQGWVEFVPESGGPVLRSRRETTQPNRTDMEYWATGLSPIYLEGALERALGPAPVPLPLLDIEGPAFDEPASDFAASVPPISPSVLNPFSVYEKGEALLRNQLAALSAWHLVNIIRAYELSDLDQRTLDQMTTPALVELIVLSVRNRLLEESAR